MGKGQNAIRNLCLKGNDEKELIGPQKKKVVFMGNPTKGERQLFLFRRCREITLSPPSTLFVTNENIFIPLLTQLSVS